jgi:spore coat protein U-like protein
MADRGACAEHLFIPAARKQSQRFGSVDRVEAWDTMNDVIAEYDMNAKITKLALAIGAMLIAGSAISATVNSTLTANLTLTSACEVSPASSIDFGSKVALASVEAATSSTASTFQVACSADATAPTIYAAATRLMQIGGEGTGIPFNLSLSAGAAADDLPSVLGSAVPLGALTQDGAFHDVVIYGKAPNSWAALPSGAYTGTVLVTVVY